MSTTFTKAADERVAMLLSVVVTIPALLARYKFADSPLFERLKQTDPFRCAAQRRCSKTLPFVP